MQDFGVIVSTHKRSGYVPHRRKAACTQTIQGASAFVYLQSGASCLSGKLSLMERVVVVTYTSSPDLYRASLQCNDLPYPKMPLHSWAIDECVAKLLDIEAEWIIHVDEDAFFTDTSRIPLLLKYMEDHQYVCAGVPDGGTIQMRIHNPIACNPSFLIIHRSKLLQAREADPNITQSLWDHAYAQHLPEIVKRKNLPYMFDLYEPYYGFFFWLRKHRFEVLYLDSEPWDKEPERYSTVVMDQEGKSFLVHTWFAREYHRPRPKMRDAARQFLSELKAILLWKKQGAHYARIQNVIAEVKNSKGIDPNG